MKRIALAIVIVGSACKAKLPELTDAHGGLDAKCTGPHADSVVDVSPPMLANPEAALGAPDGMSVSLTANAVITVGFIGLGGITDTPNVADLKIDATVASDARATVELAGTDMEFRFAGNMTAGVTSFDVGVATIDLALYARVIDVTGAIEIDAFEAPLDMCRAN